ncbi:acetate kinase, partial [Candidatus Peregrinibacteria bacterium]|nr:acetate kinase [Candidatus Peregrinibacteria bacterium]
IDPAIALIMQKQLKKTPNEMEKILNKKSGLLALSGINSDMRIIREKAMKKNKKALLAIEIFGYHLAKSIGAFTATLNGLDCLIFTGGIGENAWYIRKNVCEYLEFLGLAIDSSKNKKNAFEIHAPKRRVKILVIPTDEELAMAEKIW